MTGAVLAVMAAMGPVHGEEAVVSSTAVVESAPLKTAGPADLAPLAIRPVLPAATVTESSMVANEHGDYGPPNVAAFAAIPVGSGGRLLRWNIRPWAGASTVRLGHLDDFPAVSVNKRRNLWWNTYNARVTEEKSHQINWALVEGLSIGYQMHPMYEVGLKCGFLRTEQGSYRAKAEGGGYAILDYWTTRMDAILAMAGMSLKMPFSATTRAYTSLYLGASFATIDIYHQFWRSVTGGATSLNEAQATGFGRGFVPEFMLHLEHDLAPALAVGFDLGYRFGGVSFFRHRHTSDVNYLNGIAGAADPANTIVRDADDNILSVDHGGLIFTLALTARP